ncbi:VanZ family protein [Streptacidiphilus pinicola]|uniref:VanZ family protein n=1 Tax=Streptacidiphilus pinicola TaxID=2219663 RepID=A0A2X0KEG3_9ACTN|nr:VanZ family protein [Streptacidiphilus pinicola]RAG87425.1 VanZ family protein [Streptacidiphilus pinicola]
MQHGESTGHPRPFTARPGGPMQPSVHAGARRLGLLLLTVHLAVLLWATFRSTPSVWLADSNLTPFASVRAELSGGTARDYLELLGSLLSLAPLGVLLPLAGGRRDASPVTSFTRTLLTGILIATGLEVLQTTLSLRLLNVDDILLPCIGIALTHLAVVPATRAWLRHRAATAAGPAAVADVMAHTPEGNPESVPENRASRSTNPGRVRIIGGADATALPAREA